MRSASRHRSPAARATARPHWCGWALAAVSALVAVAFGAAAVHGVAGSDGLRAGAVVGAVVGFLLTLGLLLGSALRRSPSPTPEPAPARLGGAPPEAIAGEVVWEVSPDGRMTYVDERAATLFGWDAATLTGQSIGKLLHPQELPRATSVLAQAVASRVGWSDESFRVLHSSGEVRWIHTSGLAHVGDDGMVRGFTAVSRLFRDGDVVSGDAAVTERVDQLIHDGLLRTAFQPIVCVRSGRVVGVEAMSRFPAEPAQGPDQWFRDADRAGRGVELELAALERAASRTGSLPAHLYLSLNVSPATLTSVDLPLLLEGLGLSPDRVVVEVTEHVGVDNYDQLQAARQRLRAAGIRLAVDDAGAGFASFRHIVRLQPDVIKLDRGIISGIHAEPAQRALAGALVSYAHEVGALVVAEGVETAEELSTVACLGVDAVQGYLLGRPTEEPGAWRQWHRTVPVPTAVDVPWARSSEPAAALGR